MSAASVPPQNRIEAVAFDVDGTLYSERMMQFFALPFALKRVRFLSHFRAVRRELRAVRPIGDLRGLQAELLGERLGVEPEEAERLVHDHIHSTWEGLLERLSLFPYVREFIEGLQEQGFKTAVMSDFPVESKLEILGLDVTWDCAFSSEEVGYLKPNPEPFLHLAERLGVEPARILYVGNSYRYDIEGAHSVGMETAHRTRRPPADSVASVSFRDFRELEGWLEKNPENRYTDSV